MEAKKFNIWVGCSLGNKYFTKEHLREYISWALKNTKDDVLLVVPDRIHAINLEILDGYSKERALKVAIKKGDELTGTIEEIISKLPKEKNISSKSPDVMRSKTQNITVRN